MKNAIAVLLAILITFTSMPLMGAVPVCQLGGPTAMDTNRQLADGERFVLTDRPLVVNLQFRPTKERPEQVGECVLPSHSEVAVDKNGILLWVKECGNNEVNRNIFVTPFNLQGIPGPAGPMGPQGPPGPAGRDGRDYYVPPPTLEFTKRSNKKTLWWILGGVALGGLVFALASSGGGGKSSSQGNSGETGGAH